MVRRVRVWGVGALVAASLLTLELTLLSVARVGAREVLAPGPASLDEVLATLAAALAVLLGAWLAVSSTAAVLAHAPGRVGRVAGRLAAVWAPVLTRRAAAVLVGAVVGSTLAPSAAVGADGLPTPGFGVTAGTARDTGPGWAAGPSPARVLPRADAPPVGWTPSRPVQRPVASPTLVTSGRAGAGDRDVVVHRGDTLWDLVAAHLGPDATDAEVAATWPRWHDANRAVIGDDPDRLLPGQVLRVPTVVVTR